MLVHRQYLSLFVLFFVTYSTSQAQSANNSSAPLIDANTRFAFKLFRELNTKNPDHNLLVAPTGLSLTFGLLENGSDPETRQEIEKAFEFSGLDLAQINDGFAALRKEMRLIPPPPVQKPKRGQPPPLPGNPNVTVIADSLWGRRYFTSAFQKTRS